MSSTNTVVVTIVGEPPIYDGQTYTTLTLRKMKAKDLVAGDLVTGEARKSFAIFASMAGVPIQVIEDLDIEDFESLGVKAAPLMGKMAAAAMAKAQATEAP